MNLKIPAEIEKIIKQIPPDQIEKFLRELRERENHPRQPEIPAYVPSDTPMPGGESPQDLRQDYL